MRATVKPHADHLLIVAGDVPWGFDIAHLEGSNARVAAIRMILDDVAARKRPIGQATKVSLSRSAPLAEPVDVIRLTTGERFPGADVGHWREVRDTVLDGGPKALGPSGAIDERVPIILVCVHQERDERCGATGPPLLAALAHACQAAGITAELHGVSHVGGHKFAGNVIIYPGGTWYGMVDASDASELVRRHFVDGEGWPARERTRIELPEGL